MYDRNRKRRRTALTGIAIMALIAGLFPFGTLSAAEAASPAEPASRIVLNDIQGHWAEQAIESWADLGLAQGRDDGSFHPEQEVTRAEFIALANRMYGYTERAAVDYLDVADAWYATDVRIATAAGYIAGYQDHTFRPNEPISRQEAAVVIARLLGLEQSGEKSELKFNDKAAIPAWSRGAIAAVVDQGYMKGYPDGTFRPVQPITRAEAIVALDQTAAMKIAAAGTYGPDRQVNTIHGNVIITSPDVTLQNVRITGNLLLAQSVGEGDVTLNGITVEGSTVVSGGGEHSVHVIDSRLYQVIVDKKTGSVRIVASGSTNIDRTSLKTGAALETDEAIGSGFGDVTVAIDETTGNPVVSLSGRFTSVIVDTPNVSVELLNGSINELKVNGSAARTKLSLAENANVDALVLDSNTEVTGNGSVKYAKVNVSGSTFDRMPDRVEPAQGVVIEVNDPSVGTVPAASGNNGVSNGNGNTGNGNAGNGGDTGNNGNETVKPTVASVANVADIVVVHGTTLADSLSALAKTTAITDSDHASHTVNLSWTIAGYDGNQAGAYTAIGTFALPAEVAQANPPVPLNVTAIVTVKAAVVTPVEATVVTVTYASDIAVDFATTLDVALSALDQTASVTDSVYTTHIVHLNWTIDHYDGNQAGVYAAVGTFALPSGVTQANPPIPLSVTANVTVNDPYIISVADVDDLAVDYGTSEADAVAALTNTTTITDKAGMTHTVNLDWIIDGYDSAQVGVYTATGTFILPSGVTQTNPPVLLNVTANVTVNDAYIDSVASAADIAVDYGTSMENALSALDQTATVTDNAHASHIVNLDWTIDNYDGNQPGVYTAVGTFVLPSGVSQANPPILLSLSANVTVNDPHIVSIADVADLAVDYGTSGTDAIAALAATTTITDNAGATHAVNLNWAIDDYDGAQAGTYIATGAFNLPSGIIQANPPVQLNVTANVTVNEAYIVSVADVADLAVDYGTSDTDAIAALAATTTITDNVGATHTVNLNWAIDGYNGAQANTYAAIGTFILPSGVSQGNPPIPLSVTANVTVNDPYIVSVADVTDLAVDYGTLKTDAIALLATTTTMTDNAGATHAVNLDWTIDGYDNHQAGVYTATGTFALPADVVQANPPVPLSVTANVTVNDPNLVSIAGVADIAVDYGTSEPDAIAALATTTTITDKTGASHTVNLDWTIDGYDGARADIYAATGTFVLPSGVSQANPAVPLEVDAKVTVKDFNILFALTSGDASEIVIGFEAPLAAPSSPAGLTVMVNGVSNPVVTTTLDADPSKLRIGLAASVPYGTVLVSYEPPGLTTAGGSALPAFSNLEVPTAGSLAEQLSIDGETLDSIIDTLKTDGFSPVVVVQALQTNGYSADETAAALKAAQISVDSTAAGLLYAGYPVANVAAALKQVYLADSITVAAAVLPMAGTAEELVAALASAGFTQPSEIAQALYATNFAADHTAAALWSRFSGTPGQLGSALTGAGYRLSDAVAAVLGLNGGNNTVAVAAAWPGVFGESGALAPVGNAAASLRLANLTASETNALLVTLYPTTYKTDPNLRASALKAGGYDATDVARLLESDFYKRIQPGSDIAITNVLNGNGYSPLLIAQAIQTVFGYDASALATNVLSQMGINTLDTLQMLQQAGFGDIDVARAAIALMPGSIKPISPFLHLSGYTGEQTIAMLKSGLIQEGSFTVTGVADTLSRVTFIDGQAEGYYSTAEIASVLQKVFGQKAETVGVEILKLGNVYDLQEVALALQSLYAIDGYEFIKIRNAYLNNKSLTTNLADNNNRPSGEWRLLLILKDIFGMNATEALAGLRDAARTGSVSTVMSKIQIIYGSMTAAQKIEAMTQAGFNLAEIAGVIGSGQTLPVLVGYLHDAGYSAEAVAQYLLDVSKVNDVTTADNLMSAGYGSCVNLEPIMMAMKQVYQSDDARLLEVFMGSGRDCTSTQVSTVLAAMGSSIDFPIFAATDLYSRGEPATQAVSLLQQVYAKSDITEIANILKQVGYSSRHTMTAIRSTIGLSPSDAKSMLASVFGITGDVAVTQAMKEIGYSVADIVPLLGTSDPFVLRGYLQAANVQAMDALIQLYGPEGVLNDPLTLSINLKALGVDRVPATAIMHNYGYTPAEIGSLLWSNGYDLPEVAAGVNQALTPVANEFWMTTMAKALKQMTTCTDGVLADLPACSAGNSTFTYMNVIEAIAASLGNYALDCSTSVPQCSIVLETMRNAGYSVPTAAGTLYADFHLSLRSLSALLQNTHGYTTPKEIADLLKQAPFHANVAQIADALHHTTFSMGNIHFGLIDIAGGEVAAFGAMKDAGYSIIEITRAMGSYTIDRSLIVNNLQAIGYGHTEAFNATLAVNPISVEEWMGAITGSVLW
ncbi:S-layer homology domain-containing protein [Cohnella panacarvi]|uniref:S-layer homology domain-containing protein n=1 Tax=Cohnella panacarvi TaxID=400776 RepID=UPI00047A918F|nr:S-layer homology domain-containing protein [Cohnella panacarvi]